MKIWHKMLLTIFLVFTLWGAAVAFLGFSSSVSWREEVLLHDGQKIIVKRSQSYGGRHEIGQSAPVKEQDISFELPGTGKKITWKNEYSKDIGRANFELLALHILDDIPYIVTTPRLCLSYNKWGRPNPPYVIFKYTSTSWQRIPFKELPSEFTTLNMTIETKGFEKEIVGNGVVTPDKIHELNKRLPQPQFQSLLREPLPQEQIDWCVEKFRTKNGWTSIYMFKSQPTYERCINVCKLKEVLPGHCPCDRLFSNDK